MLLFLLSFLGVCKGQFSEMLFIQKCPVRGLKSFRHEIILPYFFGGVVGQKIAKNATFLGGFFEGLDVKISVFFARPFLT